MLSYKIYASSTYDIDTIIATLLIGYILFEVGFFFYYKWVLVPFANAQITYHPSAPYRDYPQIKDREKLLLRILDRLEAQAKQENKNLLYIYYDFIESWFQTKNEDIPYDRFSEQFDMATLDVGLCPPKLNAWSSMGATTSSSLDDDQTDKSSTESLVALSSSPEETKKTNKGRIQKDNMDEFLTWAFFGLPLSTVQTSTDMQNALNNFYNILSKRTGLTFEPGNNPNYTQPRSFTFEQIRSLYRPYIVYIGVSLLKMTACIILYILGFKQYTCTKGLRYWHRSSRPRTGSSPFLFFHGIAPGGYAPYLPMIFGILRDKLSYRQRDIFLFENKPVSYALCFDALSEEDTIHGVLEAINLHLDKTSCGLTLMGHSFGSCQIAWLIKSQDIKNRISSIILCDPVSILLSAPDVVVNFLYRRQGLKDSYNGNPNRLFEKLIRFINETKIHLVASSELFIEHYLRRNFAWYNSELWLQDIPSRVNVLVCLADGDEIVHTPNIKREINCHNSTISMDTSDGGGDGCIVEKIIWKDVGHAHCMMSTTCFDDIHEAMVRMETERNTTDSKIKLN